MLFLLILVEWFHYNWNIVSTAFFLKLIIGGHLLIFVAHTKERWYKFLPSKQVIWAVVITQALATGLVTFGLFMNKLPLSLVLITWVWAIFWMQVSDYMKVLQESFSKKSREQQMIEEPV